MSDPKILPSMLKAHAEARRCRHTASPPAGRFVTKGATVSRLVSTGEIDAFEGDDGWWYGTSRIGKAIRTTDPCPTRGDALIAARMHGEFEVIEQPTTALVFAQPAVTEVWLLDTGKLLVVDDLHPAWRQSVGFMMRMRQRRKIRFFVPVDEVSKLGDLETMFSIANRGFEIRHAVGSMRRWSDERDRLQAKMNIIDDRDPASHAADVEAFNDHCAKKDIVRVNALRTIDGLTAVFPQEKDALIGTAAFSPRQVAYPTPEERKKLEAAKNPQAAVKDKKKKKHA
jgi:hypothetical protein